MSQGGDHFPIMQQSETTRLYKSVIEEVIRNVRNDFVNMGVDEQVLYDLQMLWEQKLMDYKVVSPSEYFGNSGLPAGMSNPVLLNPMIGPNGQLIPNHPAIHTINHAAIASEGGLNILANGAVAATSIPPSSQQPPYPFVTNNPNDNYGYLRNNRNTYYHPSQGYFEASSTAAPTSAANLPNSSSNPNHNNTNNNNNTNTTSNNNEKQNSKTRKYDGAGDSEDVDSLKQNPDDIIKLLYTNGDEEVVLPDGQQQQQQQQMGGKESSIPTEDEINSDLDDDDDEDDQDDDGEGYDESGTMDENVVLCQYEKVNRTRNKWRCVFKSGIIHVNGIDYVFTKANGEFEW